MDQAVQIVGAILILAAFIALQVNMLSARSYVYLLLNAAGSGILGVLAAEQRQWGFLLLEGVWALVSIRGIAVRLRGRG